MISLKNHQFKVKPGKFEHIKQEVIFLDHVISYGGIKLDQAKIDAFMKYKKPQSLTQVLSFLSLVQYYRRFIEGLALIAKPPYFLTSKNSIESNGALKWDDNCQEALEKQRSILTSDSFLILPD